jgi:NADH-quinone oxidoreductase subunit M
VFFFSGNHILVTVLLTPLAGAVVLLFLPSLRPDLYRKAGNAFGVLGLAVTLPLLWKFKSESGERFQFVADANWIPSLGVHFRLGIDGISLLMVLLTTLLGAIAISSSWSAIQKREKEYYILLLLLQTATLGVFMSLDFVLFYVFWEFMLVPMYLLIGVWGTENRADAPIKFFLYTIGGSAVMLLAILGIYQARGTFDMREILLHPFTAQSGHLGYWLFWGFFFAFAIRVPMFPFHTWLADACAEAPTAASVILVGVVLKTGAFGFLRFSLAMFPDAAWKYRGLLIDISLIAIVYGALICVSQKDMKRLIAYSSVSQMGLCTLGIFVFTPLGLYGSIIQQVSHGIAMGALLLIVGILYERRGTRLIAEFGGLAAPMPKFAAIYMIASLAALGMPLLSGFIGEFTILRGAFEVRWQWAAWALVGVILVAAALVWMYQRVVFGSAASLAHENFEEPADLSKRELATLIPLLLLSLWIGIYPAPMFRILRQPVELIIEAVHPGYYKYPAARLAEPIQPSANPAVLSGTLAPEAK